MRHTVDFLYSLYDALVSINVPNDKARAVVDAMERDMATTLATKQDLFLTGKDLQALSKDLQAVRTELKQDVQVLRDEFKQELQLLRGDMARGFAEQQLTLTLRLGSMLAIYTGLLFAGLKLV